MGQIRHPDGDDPGGWRADAARGTEAAWKAGGGDTKISASALKEADHNALIGLYMKKTWAPSKTLKTIGTVLK